jgi:penicillin amidase
MTFATRLFPAALESVQLFKPARQVWTVPEMATAQAEPLMTPWVEPTLRGGFTPAEASFAPLMKLGRMKGLGSNNWAVDGQHTETGRPLLAGDPHIGCDFSGLMYPIHLNSADSHGSFDVVGYTFVAAPGIAAGHNRQVAWTPTSSFADVMDMWQVQITGDGAVIAGETVPVEKRTEVIRVRGQDDREFSVTEVPGYGVVVPGTAVGSPLPLGENGREVIVGWRGFGARTANYFLELNRVGDLDEFEAAVQRMPEMSYNFVAADSKGIAYQVGVEVPRRGTIAPGREPWIVMDGSDPEAWWQDGALGPEQLPHSRGESRGWIVTANNDPFGHTAAGFPGTAPYYYGAFFPPGWRAGRIVDEIERLTARGEVTLDDMMALQTDTHSNLADDLLPLLDEIEVEDGDEAALRSLMLGWDRQMQRGSAAALAFHIYAHLVTGLVLSDDIPFVYDVVMQVQPVYLLKVASLALRGEFPRGDEVLQGGRDAILRQGLTDTAALLRERFGSVDPASYTLADLRQTNLDGGFGWGSQLGTVPTDGGESTVNVASTFFLGDDGAPADHFVGTWIPIERTVTTFADDGTPQAWTSMPQGNVADPDSPHYDDLMDDWIEGRYRRLNFTREEVEAATESSFELRR